MIGPIIGQARYVASQVQLSRIMMRRGTAMSCCQNVPRDKCMKKEFCSKCGCDRRPGQRNCKACHASNMRAWRKANPMTEEQRLKDKARSYAGEYKRRGILVQVPCQCGATETEMHHPDYAKPLAAVWLCRPCHLKLHRSAAQNSISAL